MTTLLLPSLPRALREAPGLAALLGRARRQPDAVAGLSAQVAGSFGLDAPERLPWAALLARSEGLDPGTARWLALEPLSLRVAPNGVYVVACNEFGQAPQAMRQLWDAVAGWLAEEDLALHPGHGIRAYIRLPDAEPDPATVSAEDLLGVELTGWFPAERRWRRRLNEIQIAWSQHAVNLERLAAGALPVNSPWFGRASQWQAAPTAPEHIDSSDPLLQALAGWSGTRLASAVGAGALLDRRDAPGAGLDLLQRHPGAAWQLNFACGARFELRRHDRWRFWKAPLAIEELPA